MMQTEVENTGSITVTSGQFTLHGGRYMCSATAGSFASGSASLEQLMPDGATFSPVVTIVGGASNVGTLSATGSFIADLPPGQYKWVLSTTMTGFFGQCAQVPF